MRRAVASWERRRAAVTSESDSGIGWHMGRAPGMDEIQVEVTAWHFQVQWWHIAAFLAVLLVVLLIATWPRRKDDR